MTDKKDNNVDPNMELPVSKDEAVELPNMEANPFQEQSEIEMPTIVNEEPTEEVAEEVTEEVNEEPVETTEESTEETEYTYGEVLEDFGDDVVIDGQEVELPKDDEVKPE
jgi:hypothetical protein